MTSLILRIEIGRADIDTPCECSQTRRWSAVGVQHSSAAENCKRAKSDSGAGAKIVHDGPESVFTMARNGRSRCAGIGVHVCPENARSCTMTNRLRPYLFRRTTFVNAQYSRSCPWRPLTLRGRKLSG